MSSKIDRAAGVFATQAERIRKRLVNELVAAYRKSEDPAVLIERILSVDFGKYIIQDLGLSVELDSLLSEYDSIAKDIAKIFGSVSRVAVEQLKTLDSLFFMRHVRDVGDELKRQMVYAVYTDISEKALLENLMSATARLSEAQIGSLVNTALRTFSRGTFAATAVELSPPNAKYRYTGGELIETSRPFCVENFGKVFTLEEAMNLRNDQGGCAFIEGGGFNCRHFFELVVE